MLQVSSSRPCKLKPGEVRRVPQERRPGNLIGFHVCCPRCGFVSPCVRCETLEIREGESPSDITFEGTAKCVYCRVEFGIAAGEFHLVEGDDVRAVRYR
jgi:hypothetical protein